MERLNTENNKYIFEQYNETLNKLKYEYDESNHPNMEGFENYVANFFRFCKIQELELDFEDNEEEEYSIEEENRF